MLTGAFCLRRRRGQSGLADITLDGNTFEDSRSVDKKWFVPAEGVGFCVGNRHSKRHSPTSLGNEFEHQPKHTN